MRRPSQALAKYRRGLASVILGAFLAACSATPAPSAPSSTAPSVAATSGLALKEYITEPIGKDNVEAITFSPDGKRLAIGAADGVLAIYTVEKHDEEPLVAQLHGGFVSGLAWSPDGTQILSAAADGSVRQARGDKLQVIHSYTAFPGSHPAVAWSADGRQLALAQGRNAIQVFDAADGSLIETFDLPNATTRALWWLPGGDIVASDDTGQVSFFAHGQTKAARSFKPSPSRKSVNSLSLSPNGASLAVGYDDGSVVLLDPATAKQTRELVKGRQLGTATFSPNSRLIAVSSVAFDLKLFDAEGKLVAKEDVGYDVNGTAWSSDGKYLAAGTDAHDFRIWQLVPPQTPSRPVPAGPAYMGR